MDDVREFLETYQETLNTEISTSGWPSEITSIYSFESCLKYAPGKEVYLVVDRRTWGKAVLRVTSRDSADRADGEWAILSQLNHPGIPKTYGRLVVEDKSYIIREYVPGQPLDAVVAQRLFTPQEVFMLAKKLCIILDYLHRQTPPVIHRDIKPQNIILKANGEVVLTDFGIARTFKPGADSDTQYAGTLPYAPPEQYGYAQSTPQTDIYALGIVLIYLATGSPDRQNLSSKIQNKRLLTLINRCIAFDPADRFASIDDVVRFIDGKRSRETKIVASAISGSVALLLVLLGILVFVNPFNIGLGTGELDGQNGNSSLEGDSPVSGKSFSDGLPSLGSLSGEAVFDSSVGNTTGNLTSGGYAVQGEGEAYVSFDGAVYAVGDDGTIGRVVVEAAASSLNFYEGKLYYLANDQIMSVDPKTGETKTIWHSYSNTLSISDGKLYFVGSEKAVCSINLDGTNMVTGASLPSNFYRNIINGYAYFANTEDDETLYRMNIETGETEQLYDLRSAWVSVYGEKLFFSDFTIPGKLICMDIDGGNMQELLSGSYSHVNATGIGLFYENPDGLQIEFMSYEDNSRRLIIPKKCGQFCVTNEWIFYKNSDDGDNLWMARIDGTDDQPFSVS